MATSKRRKPKAMQKRMPLSKAEIAQRLLDAHFHNAIQDEESWNENSIEGWSAFVRLQKQPNKEDFDMLCFISNDVALLMNNGYCEPDNAIYYAQEALIRIAGRGDKTGSYALDADAMKWIPRMLGIWDDIYKTIPRKVLIASHRKQYELAGSFKDDGAVVYELPPLKKRKLA